MYIILINNKPFQEANSLKQAMKLTEQYKAMAPDKKVECAQIKHNQWVLLWEEQRDKG